MHSHICNGRCLLAAELFNSDGRQRRSSDVPPELRDSSSAIRLSTGVRREQLPEFGEVLQRCVDWRSGVGFDDLAAPFPETSESASESVRDGVAGELGFVAESLRQRLEVFGEHLALHVSSEPRCREVRCRENDGRHVPDRGV